MSDNLYNDSLSYHYIFTIMLFLYFKEIISSFNSSEELKWPPTAHDLAATDYVLPPSLATFLSYVLSGKSTTHSDKDQRLIASIGQDICRAATKGEWKLPKHVLVCLTLRHMFRSEQLITLLNRLDVWNIT